MRAFCVQAKKKAVAATNTKLFLAIADGLGGFDKLIWAYAGFKPIAGGGAFFA
jgi:hypothetical protein